MNGLRDDPERDARTCLARHPKSAKDPNAINRQLTTEVVDAAERADIDPAVGCIVITGSTFAAGADIKEMQHASYAEIYGGKGYDERQR